MRRRWGIRFPKLHVGLISERLKKLYIIALANVLGAVLPDKDAKQPWFVVVNCLLFWFICMPWTLFYLEIGSGRKRHAMHLGRIRGKFWILVHFFLIIGIVLIMASIAQLRRANTVADAATRWVSRLHYGTFVFGVVLLTVVLYLVHEGRGQGNARIRLKYRLGSRVLVGAVIFLLAVWPKIPDNVAYFVGIGLLLVQSLMEAVGRLHVPRTSGETEEDLLATQSLLASEAERHSRLREENNVDRLSTDVELDKVNC
eukprot:c16137_g1_i2.p1 GENE.c16137_g1_i2~~c16137_g1_i2.p1  ORF type:complete len:257 (+),score=47.32 c16137_g1_i2:209-979(+)